MADEDPNLELPEIDEKQPFPWAGILIIVAVISAAAIWILYGKSYQTGRDTSIAGLHKQLTIDTQVLDQERQNVFDITNQLEALKQSIQFGKVPDHQKAVAQYNKLVAEQRAQREKVKVLADQYNDKVAKLHQLQ
jgi:hypothetical protein